MRYVASKNQKEIVKGLKTIYKAPSKDIAEENLMQVETKWGKKYPIVINSWLDNWDNLSVFFDYPADIRRMVYTTNIVEGYHRQVRRVTKNKGVFTNDKSLEKLVYLAARRVMAKWTMPIQNCGLIVQQLVIRFGKERLGLRI